MMIVSVDKYAFRGAAVAAGAAIVLSLAAAPVGARPDSRAMTCQYAQAFVKQHGTVVMSTGPYTYERFVVGMGYCGPQESTRLLTAPTLDNPRCRVGYICETNKFD